MKQRDRLTLGWIWGLFAVLLMTGTATQEGFLARHIVSLASLPLLAYFLVFRTDWEQYWQSRWIGWGLVAALLIAVLQILPLGLMPSPAVEANIAAEAGLLDRAAPRSASADPLATFRFIGLMTLLIAIWLATASLGRTGGKVFHWILISLAAASLILGGLHLIGLSDGHLIWENAHKGRLTGPFANANHMAAFLNVVLAYVLFGAIRTNRRSRRSNSTFTTIGYVCAAIVLSVSIYLTQSKAGWVISGGSAVLIGGFAVLRRRRLRARTLWAGVLVFGIIAPLTYGIGSVAGLLTSLQEPIIIEGRVNHAEVWRASAAVLKDHLFLGVGFGGFDEIFPFYEDQSRLSRQFINEMHNDVFQLIIEGGVIAFIALAVIVWRSSGHILQLAAARDFMTTYRAPAVFGCLIIMAYSYIDFPAQNWLIASLFVAMLTILYGSNLRRTVNVDDFKANVVVL